MLKRILLVVAVVLVGFIAFVASRPATFEIKRSATINTPAEVVYEQVADFKKWPQWSPWDAMDPTMVREYNGSPSGTGAHYSWKGNDKAGEGQMTITEATPPERIGLDLEFIKPFPASNRVEFTFKNAGASTETTWIMSGKNGFMQKLFGLFFDMDKLVGPDFEKGLASLKKISEDAAALKVKQDAEAAAAAAKVDGTEATEPTDAGTP